MVAVHCSVSHKLIYTVLSGASEHPLIKYHALIPCTGEESWKMVALQEEDFFFNDSYILFFSLFWGWRAPIISARFSPKEGGAVGPYSGLTKSSRPLIEGRALL